MKVGSFCIHHAVGVVSSALLPACQAWRPAIGELGVKVEAEILKHRLWAVDRWGWKGHTGWSHESCSWDTSLGAMKARMHCEAWPVQCHSHISIVTSLGR